MARRRRTDRHDRRPGAPTPPPAPSRAGARRSSGRRRRIASIVNTAIEDAVEKLRVDREALDKLVQLGVLPESALESDDPFAGQAPLEVVQHYLRRTAQQRPSYISKLGLTALEVLSAEAEREPPESETTARPELTVTFTDLEGFTAFTAAEGDDAASRLLRDHYSAIDPVVRARGGRMVKRLGDGVMLTFPAPEAGVMACLDLLERPPEPLALRAGAHLGSAVVTRDDVVGHVVNIAARITDFAQGGEALISADLRKAVGSLPGAHFGKPRTFEPRGLGERLTVVPVSPS